MTTSGPHRWFRGRRTLWRHTAAGSIAQQHRAGPAQPARMPHAIHRVSGTALRCSRGVCETTTGTAAGCRAGVPSWCTQSSENVVTIPFVYFKRGTDLAGRFISQHLYPANSSKRPGELREPRHSSVHNLSPKSCGVLKESENRDATSETVALVRTLRRERPNCT